VGHGADEVRAALEGLDPQDRVRCVLQEPQLGTGHAAQVCLPELGSDPGVVLLLYGDMPLLRRESLEALCRSQAASGGGAAVLTACPEDPRAFGRILRGEGNRVRAIVEERDASPEVLALREVNLGVYAFPGRELVEILPDLSNENAQGEYYVTDVVAALGARGLDCLAVEVEDELEAIGVNTLAHLAEAREALQYRLLEQHMAAGVLVEDPASTYVDHGVRIGRGTRILPCTVIRSGVTIGEGCEVGPFTHLRPGTVLEDGAEVGNFCEVKNSALGSHTKAKHLTYVGDARIGARANIGAGTVFANYDGRAKHTSVVEDEAFVGSGTILVAPATIGRGATTGAGAVVTRNTQVPAGETWIGVPARRLDRSGSAPSPEPADSGAGS
jgi:bifunctional UDP-N-acetylglucosamine pyrophosphorylase/glucosamine-1-phosphate N-acetyltransferase